MNKTPTSNKHIILATLVIILFALLTLADASAPISGIYDVSIKGNQLFAKTEYQGTYFSEDGGLTWTDCSNTNKCNSTSGSTVTTNWVSIPQTDIQYQLTDTGTIEVSHDAGLTWQHLFGGKLASDVAEYYQMQTRVNAVVMNPGANDVQYDPASGNTLFAMGLQGVMVITPDEEIIQVGVGENQPVKLNDPMVFISIIFPFLLLAAVYITLCYGTLITISRNFWYWVLNLAALIVLGYTALDFLELFSGYGVIVGIPVLAILFVLISVLYIKSKSTLDKVGINNKQQKLIILKKAMPGGLAYFVCYLLWYLTIIPKRDWALIGSLLIILGWFIYCVVQSYQLKNSFGEPVDETI